jgi:hypothetical protein
MLSKVNSKKIQELFFDPDDFETKEDARLMYNFLVTSLGKKMLSDAKKSGYKSYLDFSVSMHGFMQNLKNKRNEKVAS